MFSIFWQTCVVGTIVSEVIEVESREGWRLAPEVRSELRRRQEKWKYGGDIPERVAEGEGIKTLTWEHQPRMVASRFRCISGAIHREAAGEAQLAVEH